MVKIGCHRFFRNPSALLLWVVLFVLVSCQNASLETPVAHNGILDAESFFQEQHSTLYLDGEWGFYPNQFVDPADFQGFSPPQFMLSPGKWKKDGDDQPPEYATYRLLLINHGLPETFSVRNHLVFSAFTLYVNGEKVLSNGVPSKTKEGETPCFHPRTQSFFSKDDTLDIVVHVSNHNYRWGGIRESFTIGEISSIMHSNLLRSGFDFFLAGSLLIMAIYYLSLFFIIRKERSSLYFSIFIFLSIIRLLVTGQRLILMLWPDLSWETLLRLEYGSFYLAPLFFILFFNAIFREEVKSYAVYVVMGVSVCFTLMVLFTPVSFFSLTLPYYQFFNVALGVALVYWLLNARKNDKEGALVLLAGIIVLFVTLLHDMIFAYTITNGKEIFPAGLFLFILCQSYVLSVRFSVINRENQVLWEELDFKNRNLELMVEERTRELIQQKELIEKANTELKGSRERILDQSRKLEDINELLEKEMEKSDELLLNVLPRHIADEIMTHGRTLAHSYQQVSVLFVDFRRFSDLSERLKPESLLKLLHYYFGGFDDIAKKYNLEKIKTIGDAYMCAGGLHENAGAMDVKNTVWAALEISSFVKAVADEKQLLDEPFFDCRIGIHTGPVIAGIVGKSKFAFDIWGPTVNIAKNMEAACEPGMVNISEFTWNYIKHDFNYTSRGIISMKHKKNMQMFYVAPK